ncbi:hypothetical protein Calhy_0380 [Caldicellulosiruptor hydrothermalis 108]|uniref:PKD domain containing protein n=1 Tax=Caldicellulosiruptor hydrothermalis (strain DSM 18901 / VKM B-2411 / 108) TaxID=632292 RepID=E4QBM6_CALH1|nr:hypothetical protein [Caldicellulosiruptor hydrothermalis]ADQ06128.1 hypothetical protein Calhy_0380 [Caldicellulosiruptor hydrothermalis 108]
MLNNNKSLFKALSFLCILSLVLSFVPPVRIWQTVKADDTKLYNGGIDSYNGQGRDYWLQRADKGSGTIKDKIFVPSINKWVYFNCEIYAERGQVVYGEPWDVPANSLASPAGFKADSSGYFLQNKTSGTRGWFRYLGYSQSGAPFSDSNFPPDLKPEVVQPNEVVELSSVPASAKDVLGLTGYDPSKVSASDWDTLFKNLFLIKEYDSGTYQTLKQLLVDSGKVTTASGLSTYVAYLGTDANHNASARIIWKDSTGRLRYRTYTGIITQGGNPKVTTKGIDGTIVSGLSFASGSGSSSLNGTVLLYNPQSSAQPSIDIYVNGELNDGLGTFGANPYYDNNTLTRNDVLQYQTRITSITINGNPVSSSIINRWTDAIVTGKDTDTVSFRTAVEGRRFDVPKDMLKGGDNTVVVTGETQVEFDIGNGRTDKYPRQPSLATLTFTIRVLNPQPPQLQLSVTPSQSTVTITNGQYSPSKYVNHQINATVTVPSPPAGYQVTAMEFYIDTNNPPAGNVITKTISNGTGTKYSFDNIKSFQYDASKIPLDSSGKGTGTPAYYGKVRYVLKDPNGNLHESPWSNPPAPVQARVSVKENSDTPVLSANSNDVINLDKNGNPTSYTVKISATANVGDTGTKTIQKWVFTAVHNENTSETGTSTVTTTGRNASTTISVPIATNKDRTTETFNVTATLYFTDGATKKTNTVKVEVPVNVQMDINLDFTGPTQIVGNEGDSIKIPLKAVATIPNKNQTIKLWRVWIRQDIESLLSPTYQTTSDVASVTATKTYPTSGTLKLTKDMNGQTLTFIARAKAQPVTGDELDSGQKTLTVKLIVNTTDKPVPPVTPPAGDVTCEGLLDPMTVPATLNPFTGEVTPDTTTVKTGIRASISDTGGRTVDHWTLYCGIGSPTDVMATYWTRKTSIEIPIGSYDSKQYTVNNKDGYVVFAYKAVVYFTDGTYKEGTDEKVFAVSWSYQNHKPTCYVNAPGIVAQGDDIYVYVTGTDEDIIYGDYVMTDITSISPSNGIQDYEKNSYNNGSTTIASFWSDTLTTYTIQGFARDKLGAGSFATANITIIPAIPLPKIQTIGDLKVNRKIIFDGSSSYSGSKRATILWNKAQWKIEPYSGLTANDIKLITPTTGVQSTSVIAKKEGQVKVTLTITNSYGNTQSTSIIVTIKPDEPPVANFTMPTKIIRDPADSSQATIQITSNSYSPDGDTIAKHAWFYAYDSNNDGNFDNETWYIRKSDGTWQAVGDWNKVQNFDIETVDTGNDTTITLKTSNVGRYKVALVVREGLDLTGISNWVSVYDLQKGNTFDWDEGKCVAEVINIAPFASLNASKVDRKTVNIIILTDKSSQSDLNAINSKIGQLKAQLYSYGVDVNVIVSNQRIVSGSTTDFKAMSCPYFFKYKGHLQFLPSLFYVSYPNYYYVATDIDTKGLDNDYSKYNNYSSNFFSYFPNLANYGCIPGKSGLWGSHVKDVLSMGIEVHQDAQSVVSIYFSNVTFIGDDNKTWTAQVYLSGYDYSFPHIILSNGDGKYYENGFVYYYPLPYNAFINYNGNSFRYNDLKWSNVYFRNYFDKSLLNGKVVDPNLYTNLDYTENNYFPTFYRDNNYIYAIGFYVSPMDYYVTYPHGLYPLISLSSIESLSYLCLSQITDGDNYVVYLSDTQGNSSTQWGQYFALSSADKNFLKILTDNNFKFIAVSPSSTFDYLMPNTPQNVTLRQLANATDGKLYDTAGNAIAQLDQALNDIKAKYTNVQLTPDPVYVLADEEKVIYYPYWEDYENDTIINQRWKYEHDETVFDNNLGKAEFDNTWLSTPIEVFTKPGKYMVTFQVQDNPPPGTDDFDNYKLWSKLERQMVLYVHRRPIADFTAVYNKSTGKVTITDNSYDPDHQYNRSDKGIIAWKWQYKTTDDTNWTDTTLANLQNMTLQSGKIYLIKLEVQDCDGPNGVGVWSKPKIAMIDLSVANNPPVADFTVDSEILKGNQPSNLTDKSYDPDNDPITAWHWWIYNSDGSTNKDFGEVTNNNIATVKSYIATMQEDSYRLSLQVKDSNNNYSAVASKWFRVYSQSKDTEQDVVNNPPTCSFTMTITDHRTRLRPQTTYSDPDGDPKNAEQWYIKFNGQIQYFDKLPDTLESAGYTYDGTYEIGYRVQDNPTSRSTKLKPLWSNWYVQTYYISTPVTINAWVEKFEKRAKNRAEVEILKQHTVKASEIRIGEALIVKAKTIGYVEKIEAWFDRVETTVKGQRVTKTITGYWEARDSQGNLTGTMQIVNLHTWLIPQNTNTTYQNNWSSDLDDKKLMVRFRIHHYNSWAIEKFPAAAQHNLWDGVYRWSDWTKGNTFDYNEMLRLYGRPSYFLSNNNPPDKLWIKVRAYRKNTDGSYKTTDVDLSVLIKGELQYGTEIITP